VNVRISIYIPCKGKEACVLNWVSSRGAQDDCDKRWDANCDAAGAGEASGELECSVRTNGRVIVISVVPISVYSKIKVLDLTISLFKNRCFLGS